MLWKDSNLFKRPCIRGCWVWVIILLFAMSQVGYGQDYATVSPNYGSINPPGLHLGGSGGVTNPDRAATIPNTTFAVMKADRLELDLGLIKVVSGKDAYLQLKFSTNRIAGATTYVKISKPTLTGLNLDLAALLGLAGTNIKSELYIGATAGNQSSHRGNKVDAETKTEIIVDEQNNYYLAITPISNVVYNSVNIILSYPSGLLSLGTFEMNVYHAFTLAKPACSDKASFTNLGEAQSVNLNLLSQLIVNPHYAINDNSNQYASYSSGIVGLGIANTVSQTVYFDHVASTADGVRVRLGLSDNLIGLGVANLNAVNFVAYNGTSQVWSENLYNLSQLLSLDLLNLVTIGDSHKEVDMVFKPEAAFDRIKIEFKAGLLSLGLLGDALRVYHVSLAPSVPQIVAAGQPHDVSVCEGETVSFSVVVSSPTGGSILYQWQFWNGMTWHDIGGATSSTLILTHVPLSNDEKKYRVRVIGGNTTCPQTIFSRKATLSVQLSPGKPHLTIKDIIN